MRNILIIEDNDNNMELITFILEAHGYKTIRAETGLLGCELAFSSSPELIILDIQLPDIDGTEVLRRIREKIHDIPIIAMTSYAMAGDREKLIEAGCTGYIEKPIDPNRVISQIEHYLGDYA
ncbi:MAG: response regulator [Gammaproteobacteria bacterium]|nr:response regulator [Gammaproteobacteria bacterium]